LGTYRAQRAASDRSRPHIAARPRGSQGQGDETFLQFTELHLWLREVGRVGLEPTTGGL
jgi:hypothetical protein